MNLFYPRNRKFRQFLLVTSENYPIHEKNRMHPVAEITEEDLESLMVVDEIQTSSVTNEKFVCRHLFVFLILLITVLSCTSAFFIHLIVVYLSY